MWRPFKKKTVNRDQLPIQGPWSIAEGKYDGRVALVRLNTGYQEFGPLPNYEHQVGIAIPLRSPEPTGLPSPEEDRELREVEDIVCECLQAEAKSLLVAVITTGGMREFVFYTREPQKVRGHFDKLRGRIMGHQIHLVIQPDKAWEVYAQLG